MRDGTAEAVIFFPTTRLGGLSCNIVFLNPLARGAWPKVNPRLARRGLTNSKALEGGSPTKFVNGMNDGFEWDVNGWLLKEPRHGGKSSGIGG